MSILKTTYYTTKKMNKEALFILLWNNHYNILLNEKNQMHSSIYDTTFVQSKGKTHISVSTYTDTRAQYFWNDAQKQTASWEEEITEQLEDH